jgi:hypothetical protein
LCNSPLLRRRLVYSQAKKIQQLTKLKHIQIFLAFIRFINLDQDMENKSFLNEAWN